MIEKYLKKLLIIYCIDNVLDDDRYLYRVCQGSLQRVNIYDNTLKEEVLDDYWINKNIGLKFYKSELKRFIPILDVTNEIIRVPLKKGLKLIPKECLDKYNLNKESIKIYAKQAKFRLCYNNSKLIYAAVEFNNGLIDQVMAINLNVGEIELRKLLDNKIDTANNFYNIKIKIPKSLPLSRLIMNLNNSGNILKYIEILSIRELDTPMKINGECYYSGRLGEVIQCKNLFNETVFIQANKNPFKVC